MPFTIMYVSICLAVRHVWLWKSRIVKPVEYWILVREQVILPIRCRIGMGSGGRGKECAGPWVCPRTFRIGCKAGVCIERVRFRFFWCDYAVACYGTFGASGWNVGVVARIIDRERCLDSGCAQLFVIRCNKIWEILGCLWCTPSFMAFYACHDSAVWVETWIYPGSPSSDAIRCFYVSMLTENIKGVLTLLQKVCGPDRRLGWVPRPKGTKQFNDLCIQKETLMKSKSRNNAVSYFDMQFITSSISTTLVLLLLGLVVFFCVGSQ